MARILIGCETSGIVRRAFAARGHDVWSCDTLSSDDGSNRHIRDDIRNVLRDKWDMLAVMHPPCTRLCNSGVRWLHEPPGKLSAEHYTSQERFDYALMNREQRLAFMWLKLDEGADLFSACWNANIPCIAVENPQMHKYAVERIENYAPAAQTIQPHWFGEPVFKATGLYLKNLPALVPTNRLIVPEKGTAEYKAWSRIHLATPGPNRWKERSRFFPGVADAMAEQWILDMGDHWRMAA